MSDIGLVCAGCGASVAADEPYPFRCPNADSGDDCDHVLAPSASAPPGELAADDDPHPFVRYRRHLRSYHLALQRGLSDAAYVALVRELDEAVAAVDGEGFRVTPCVESEDLATELGVARLALKDETRNVSGSHKGRHLFGVLLHLEVAERTLLAPAESPPLAIPSCGNAALAAAVLAKAAGRRLEVFVPPDAEAHVLARLRELDAHVTLCPRDVDGPPGDPCVHRFHDALRAGALPFAVQGNENGLAIEGGKTLGWELAEQHARGIGARLDRVAIQVGGGALASAVAQALADAVACGVLERVPKLHTVQTLGAHPLERAWTLVALEVARRLADDGASPPAGEDDARVAAWLLEHIGSGAVGGALAEAAMNRSRFMWPWEETPTSVAASILDDETYDWLAVTCAMLASGGWPVVADETTLRYAHERARVAGPDTCATGSAGLAGLYTLRDQDALASDEHAAVLFTGAQR